MTYPNSNDPISLLEASVGERWSAIDRARKNALVTKKAIETTVQGLSSTDTSIVVFGSLAQKNGPKRVMSIGHF